VASHDLELTERSRGHHPTLFELRVASHDLELKERRVTGHLRRRDGTRYGHLKVAGHDLELKEPRVDGPKSELEPRVSAEAHRAQEDCYAPIDCSGCGGAFGSSLFAT
jgi:hypothetical protein